MPVLPWKNKGNHCLSCFFHAKSGQCRIPADGIGCIGIDFPHITHLLPACKEYVRDNTRILLPAVRRAPNTQPMITSSAKRHEKARKRCFGLSWSDSALFRLLNCYGLKRCLFVRTGKHLDMEHL